MEEALSRLLGQDLSTTCAGRTDAGVHADAQVLHVDVDPDRARAAAALEDLDELRQRLDHLVGHPVTIWQVRPVPDDFDARFAATDRHYVYRLGDAETIHPLRRPDTWHVGAPLDTRAMQEAADHLRGEHDFASFCRAAEGGHTVRRIDEIEAVRVAPGSVEVRVTGPAFCHQQVRSIVGCLVEVGRGQRPPSWLADVLAARDRATAAAVAPPHGLTLARVRYGRHYPASPPR